MVRPSERRILMIKIGEKLEISVYTESSDFEERKYEDITLDDLINLLKAITQHLGNDNTRVKVKKEVQTEQNLLKIPIIIHFGSGDNKWLKFTIFFKYFK